MAIYHFTTSIIKESKGKCAVVSATYISAGKLYDKKQGRTFSYTRKEEVTFTEILLSKNAPQEYIDRETLWNAVEKVQNKSDSRYARMFEMALPNEMTTEEQIALARNFIQKNFVDRKILIICSLLILVNKVRIFIKVSKRKTSIKELMNRILLLYV